VVLEADSRRSLSNQSLVGHCEREVLENKVTERKGKGYRNT
jgi:hypothetical protein